MSEPKCPWPEDVWCNTIDQVGKLMREKLGDNDTTACSGTLMRHGWNLALKETAPELEELRRFKAAALTLATQASIDHVLTMSKEKP